VALSYAGVTLPIPTQEAVAWVEANLSLADVLEFSRLHWPSFGLSYLAFPGSLPDRPIQVGRLWWPRGASRWAMGHWLVDHNTLEQIRQNTESTTYTAQPLLMTWVNARTQVEVARISPNLFMLPARPLSQIAGFNGLHLLTLVDDRFFWWQRSTGNLSITEGTTTWEDLYALLGTALGVTITVDPIPAAYLKPSFFLGLSYAYTPVVLDAVAYNVGQRLTRALDGSVRARNPVNAALDLAANRGLAVAASKQAGGVFLFDPAELINDDPGILPNSVTVTFPQVNADSGSNLATGDLLPQVVTLASLALADIPATTQTSSGSKIFHDTAPAQYLASVLQNNAELLALAQQAATDWYRFQLSPLDVKLAGIVPWNPEALSDSVEWSYAAFAGALGEGDCCTRIQRTTFNDLTQELQHGGGAGGQSQEPPCCGPPKPPPDGGPEGPPIIPPVPIPDPPGNGGIVILPPKTGKLAFSGGGTVNGFQPAVSGQLLIIWNRGANDLILANDAGGTAGILCPIGVNYHLYTNDGVILEYDGVSKRWRFDTPTFAAGLPPVYATRQLIPGIGIVMQDQGMGVVRVSAPSAGAGVTPDLHGWHDVNQWYSWFLATPDVTPGTPFGFLFTLPFLTTTTFVADQIGISIQNLDVVTHNCRMALYKNTSVDNLYPTTLLFDTGDLPVTPTGLFQDVIFGINQTLLGLYWLVLQVDSNQLIARTTSLGNGGADYYLLGRDSPSSGGTISWLLSFAYAAFPANFPPGATRNNGGPYIHLRKGNIAPAALRGVAFGNVIAQIPLEEGAGGVLQS
jgi:hypothetical protein